MHCSVHDTCLDAPLVDRISQEICVSGISQLFDWTKGIQEEADFVYLDIYHHIDDAEAVYIQILYTYG